MDGTGHGAHRRLGDYSYTQKSAGAGYDLTTKLSNGDTYKLVQFPVGAPLLTAPSD